MLDHDTRYEVAGGMARDPQLLWERDEPINYEGKYCRAKEALLKPRPLQTAAPARDVRRPVSERRAFCRQALRHRITAFEKTGNLELMRTQVDKFKSIAWKEYDRTLKHVVAGVCHTG